MYLVRDSSPLGGGSKKIWGFGPGEKRPPGVTNLICGSGQWASSPFPAPPTQAPPTVLARHAFGRQGAMPAGEAGRRAVGAGEELRHVPAPRPEAPPPPPPLTTPAVLAHGGPLPAAHACCCPRRSCPCRSRCCSKEDHAFMWHWYNTSPPGAGEWSLFREWGGAGAQGSI